MIFLKTQLLITLVFLSTIDSFCQMSGIFYSEQITEIIIGNNGDSFTETTSKKGINIGVNTKIHLAYSELEVIKDVNIYYTNNKGKSKKLKDDEIKDESLLDNSYYSGYRVKTIMIPAFCEFEISYKKTCGEISLLSGFQYSSNKGPEKLEYIVKTGPNYNLAFNIPVLHKGSTVKVDSSENGYIFTCVNEIIKQDSIVDLTKETSPPYIRTLVWNKDNQSSWQHLNKWYYGKSELTNSLSETTISFFENLTKETSNEDSIAKIVFDYVKKKIIYIDIENGMGAFIPREPENIFIKKQGDCKDMANLMANLLKHFKIDAYLALSSTISHPLKLDFPSLSSANHVVCVAVINDKFMVLDATDNTCIYGNPSIHIQGRSILIIDSLKGILHHIPPIESKDNKAVYTMNISILGDSLSGSIQCELNGISASEILYLSDRHSHEQLLELTTTSLETKIGSSIINNLSINQKCNSLIMDSKIVLSDNLINRYKNKNLLSLNFLPYPHSFVRNIELNESLDMYQTSLNHFLILLNFETPVKLTSPKEINLEYNDMLFKLTINQTSPEKIQIEYSLQIDKITIDKNSRLSYNELNKAIQKSLSETLTYENL